MVRYALMPLLLLPVLVFWIGCGVKGSPIPYVEANAEKPPAKTEPKVKK